jgi:hypothetical protein
MFEYRARSRRSLFDRIVGQQRPMRSREASLDQMQGGKRDDKIAETAEPVKQEAWGLHG